MAGELILIVEDNEKNMKLARDILQFKGYRTLEAGCGADGLKLARDHHPDLVLMDIQLPDMDGLSALQQLRKDPRTASLRVVAFTASAMTDDVQRLRDVFDGYLTKPIEVKAFLEQVRLHCELASAARARAHQGT